MSIDLTYLESKAKFIRREVLRMTTQAGKGHLGGAFSSVELLVALYYGGLMRFDPKNPSWEKRDRFILSKGHSCEALYVILADNGFFPIQDLATYQQLGSSLSGHPHRHIAGIEADTGSLGHGLGVGAGIALAAQMDKSDYLTFVLMGDGECCEGSVWEAAMFAPKHELNNLVAIVDRNQLCVTDRVDDCVSLDPLDKKFEAFGWDVLTLDGHSFEDIINSFEHVRTRVSEKPLCVIADTVKGKGVSFMEGELRWHHGIPKNIEYQQALDELEY
ncbi:transketolase [Candidatus Omnitrophota bacterium]